jgi:GT2 family glycosyltransferase
MDKIGIVVLNYRSSKVIKECLVSLYKLEKTKNFSVRIVVVDNQYDKKRLNKLKKHFPQTEFLNQAKNMGFAGGNNIGLKHLASKGCTHYCLLNNDTFVDQRFLLNLYDCYIQSKNTSLISPKIYFAPGFEFHQKLYKKQDLGKVIWYAGGIFDKKNIRASHRGVNEVDSGQYQQVEETDFASGCCLFFNKKLIEKVGYLEEKYFMYFEDVDYSFRVQKSGLKTVYCPLSIVWHKNAVSSGGAGRDISYYFQERNRYVFGFQYAPLRTKIHLLKQLLKSMWQRTDSTKQLAAKDFLLQKLNQGSMKDL